jgi:hypothetical protein
MITFPHFGVLGRLGNQMFQYSAIYSMAKKYNIPFYLPKIDTEIYRCFNVTANVTSEYFNIFDAPNELYKTNIRINHESILLETEEQKIKFFSAKFDENYYNYSHNNKSILGFFQNYRYFQEFEKHIRKEFTFKNQYHSVAISYFNTFKDQKPIALHIRRTDYLNSDILNNLSLEYYDNALSFFSKESPVLVFSDEPAWCSQQKIFDSDRFKIITTNNTYIDLCLMSLCHFHIIANSTYSWWGSWLAKSRKTICPKQWFSEQYECLDSKELRLPNWISI